MVVCAMTVTVAWGSSETAQSFWKPLPSTSETLLLVGSAVPLSERRTSMPTPTDSSYITAVSTPYDQYRETKVEVDLTTLPSYPPYGWCRKHSDYHHCKDAAQKW